MRHEVVDGPIGLADSTELSNELLHLADGERLAAGMPGVGQEVEDLLAKGVRDAHGHRARVKNQPQQNHAVGDEQHLPLVERESARTQLGLRKTHDLKNAFDARRECERHAGWGVREEVVIDVNMVWRGLRGPILIEDAAVARAFLRLDEARAGRRGGAH